MDASVGTDWFSHEDRLASLGTHRPFSEHLVFLHKYIQQQVPHLHRIAVALYDRETDILKTFAHSSLGDDPLSRYEACLSDSPTLSEIVARRQPRTINDIDLISSSRHHARRINGQGYGASYTLPVFRNGEFLALLFFNSYEKNVFTESALSYLDLVGHLAALSLIDHLVTSRNLVASVRGASTLAQHRDFETGAHLDRMAHYSRLIALSIAPKYDLDDQTIEHIFLFSPLHDIGKIAIPDNILLKPGKLTEEEFSTMKAHPTVGVEMIDSLLDHFGLKNMPQADILRNIALYHHETLNGKGYPSGLQGDAIPVEARIAAVADIFDALTSARPYKQAWSNDEAFALLAKLAGDSLDADCVQALANQREAIGQIQSQFAEDTRG